MLEWYGAGMNYMDLMSDCEQLVGFLCRELEIGDSFQYQGNTISLVPPWDRISVGEAFQRHASVGMAEALAADRFDEVMVTEIEPFLDLPGPHSSTIIRSAGRAFQA